MSQFLSRDSNKAFAEVTGGHVNIGAGYGLEVGFMGQNLTLGNFVFDPIMLMAALVEPHSEHISESH